MRLRPQRRSGLRIVPVAAAAVAVAVAALLFWPTHIPLGGGPFALVVDVVGNVAVFALLASLIVLAVGSPVLVLLFAAALSCSAELTQATLLPDRDPSLLDIAANITGAVVGVVIGARRRAVCLRRG